MSGETPALGTAHADTGRLVWVDMLGHHIHMFDPVSRAYDRIDTPGMVTSIGLRADGGYIVGLERSVALWSPDTAFETLSQIEHDRPTADRSGAFTLTDAAN